MLTTFLLVIHALIAVALVVVILLQRSEGGGLGMGGSPSGFMSARGAADLLTRSTAVLAALFIATSLILAILSGYARKPRAIDPGLVGAAAPAAPAEPAPPLAGDPPMFPGTPAAGEPTPGVADAPTSGRTPEPTMADKPAPKSGAPVPLAE